MGVAGDKKYHFGQHIQSKSNNSVFIPAPRHPQFGFRRGGGPEEGNLKGIIPLGFPSSGVLALMLGHLAAVVFEYGGQHDVDRVQGLLHIAYGAVDDQGA